MTSYNKILVLKEIAQELRFAGFLVTERPGSLIIGLFRTLTIQEVERALDDHPFSGDINLERNGIEVKITAK